MYIRVSVLKGNNKIRRKNTKKMNKSICSPTFFVNTLVKTINAILIPSKTSTSIHTMIIMIIHMMN